MPAANSIAKKPRDYPKKWGESYSEADIAKTRWIIDCLNAALAASKGISTTSALCRAAGLATGTANTVIAGSYYSSPTKFLDAMVDTLKREQAREKEGLVTLPFVETSVFKMIVRVCERAHLYRDFGLLCGYVGTGKTVGLREYVSRTPSALLIQASTEMTPTVLLNQLVKLTGAQVSKRTRYSEGTKADKMDAVIAALLGSDKLLIFDEAETVQHSCLNHLRRISDIAGVGVVLIGTEHLEPLVQDEHGRFGQISSRIGFWAPVIKAITEDDCYLITRAAYGNDNLAADILDAYWQCCGGSARTLSKLIPSVATYCKRKKAELTANVVFDCYAKTMRPQRIKPI